MPSERASGTHTLAHGLRAPVVGWLFSAMAGSSPAPLFGCSLQFHSRMEDEHGGQVQGIFLP